MVYVVADIFCFHFRPIGSPFRVGLDASRSLHLQAVLGEWSQEVAKQRLRELLQMKFINRLPLFCLEIKAC